MVLCSALKWRCSMKLLLILLSFSFLLIPYQTNAAAKKKVLMLVTSSSGNSEYKTGFWGEEYIAPKKVFERAGFEVEVASPKGGRAPLDPNPLSATKEAKEYLKKDKKINNTKKLSKINSKDFDAIFVVGGHGVVFDLPQNNDLQKILREMDSRKAIISAVCHGPAALLFATDKKGESILKGHCVSGFSNSEENQVEAKVKKIVIHKLGGLLEDLLNKKSGSKYKAGKDWAPFHCTGKNSHIVTGQNPSSSKETAEAVVKKLKL